MPRKKPFSVKQKKKQLQDKRERKRGLQDGLRSSSNSRSGSRERREEQTDTSDGESVTHHIRRLNQQPSQALGSRGYDPNRYRLHFERDSREEVERRKRAAREQVLQPISAELLVLDIWEVYQPGSVLDFPRRPPWSYEMSKEQLMSQEERSFQEYLGKIYGAYTSEKLSYFEHNLETWRQLWRVLEMSDIVLLITDIRHPDPSSVLKKSRRRGRGWTRALGPEQLLRACEAITAGKVDLSSWREKIARDVAGATWGNGSGEEEEEEDGPAVLVEQQTDSAMEPAGPTREHYKDGVVTIGCVGFPNVGKSSLINGLVGRKVVSVSRTPGHTRYFQTYFLTPSVKLCDCPGLIFPSLLPRQLQVLAGVYPIAQIQEPYTAVGYLASRVPVQALLHLRHPEAEDPSAEHPWCAWDICEAWAEKRGYKTAKAARNDVYRAANSLLRLALDGRLSLCFQPPGYSEQKGTWESHPETMELVVLQGRVGPAGDEEEEEEEELSSSCEEEGEEDRDADEEGEGDEDTPTSAPGSSLAARNPYALLGEDEC
ncbi:guanine nucleotide-binding protein-like 1 isoform X6 [Balaenoptera musculus]|uniref:Guanine nucleotide-binding protein-like 1 n=1 Tax=Balaenoptera musculus TaxID=9771 RepID=A0A8B8YQP1_BALMU|nr:guanine nucleotide-binding protein-like 1 isoform X6 [Balaenoptera musculus]